MGKQEEDGSLTPCVANPLIPRINGDGHYEVGDRVLARDIVGKADVVGTVGAIASNGPGDDYLIIVHGDDLFYDNFLAKADDVMEMLPDPEDAEQLLEWLEGGA